MRVIAGRLGGRELRAPKGTATRPTTDRVREALFSVLGDVTGARVLDLYAGSGALGIEALSRGAASAVFVESHAPALAALRGNIARLDLASSTTVLALRVERAGTALRTRAPFDLVLCDPPWAELDACIRAVSRLLEPALLAADARVVIEHPTRSEVEMGGAPALAFASRRTWGDTSVSIFASTQPNPDLDPSTA
jgi:16S rRNA (guanine(966)-N(2))-methyltransferase RsmD